MPYENPAPSHTAGLSIPLDRYIDFLYRSKTFSVTGTVNYTDPARTFEFEGSYNRQFFSGPRPIVIGFESEFEAEWASKQMTAATRRVCYGEGGDMLPLRLHDPGEYALAGGSKVVAGFMNWVGSITTTSSGPGGTSTVTALRNFFMPCFNYPVEWGETPVISSGVKKAASHADPWLIFARGSYPCTTPGPESYYGSLEDFDDGDYDATTAKLVLDGDEFPFLRSGPPNAGSSFAGGTLTLTRTSTW